MNKGELSTVLNETLINADQVTAELYFILKQEEGTVLRLIDVEENTQQELTQEFINKIQTDIINDPNLDMISISNADDRTNVIYEYDLDEVPHELELINDILADEDIPAFDIRTDNLKQICGVVVLISNNGHNLLLYKKHYPVSLIKKDNIYFFGLIGDHRRFISAQEDVVRINTNFEFMKIDDTLLIKDLNILEKFFGFHDVIKKKAEECIVAIEQACLLENTDVLYELIEDISFSRKLTKVLSSSPVLNRIPTADVIAFTDTYLGLKGKFKYNSDKSRILLDTKQSKHLFAKLLNDDYLQSELTKMCYASLAKDTLNETAAG
ncbi:anti-phage protein KwaB [Paenibacillus radicis (ex Xue et al. 2023)]|uniref:DUF4868 domain-containing protein n=1 Tax=Paenibacillus radicis (ex Xue et al. 2023) TaxID=2972489 RepID=A0ABT1YBY5_9BACL|nr:anti-phage protein KwaB [Paenibacillus radicis (ex Xue et al. 2023)]MCR8630709.1 DUF4868 domain-containing protein [Paenibacillus radicis (ex Xue et al. 2023)]